MEKIKLKCPFCGGLFLVNDNPGNVGKNVKCPHCKQVNVYESYKKVVQSPISDETELPGSKKKVSTKSFFLIDKIAGRKYMLKEGRNLIGRMTYSTPPEASIPIETIDKGMSRAHLFIDVMLACDGVNHCYASNASNKNPTYINDVLLEEDEKLALHVGDIIKMANTELEFGTIVKYEDDETIL